MNILIETKATWHIYRGLIIYCGAKKLHPFYFLSNFKSRSSLITFGAENEYKRKQFQNYPPLLMNYECHYTTLWNTTCVKLFITTTVQALIVMINWQLRTNTSQQMFKMFAFGFDMCIKTISPLINCLISDALLVSRPCFNRFFRHFRWMSLWTMRPLTSAKCQFPWRSDG